MQHLEFPCYHIWRERAERAEIMLKTLIDPAYWDEWNGDYHYCHYCNFQWAEGQAERHSNNCLMIEARKMLAEGQNDQ